MRDPQRIEVILGQIEQAWKLAPDLRFWQLLINIFGVNDWYYLEDHVVSEQINEFILNFRNVD